MKNFFTLALFVTLALSFNSCKKCYTCIKQEYSYCGNVQASAFGQNINFNQCFADSDARNSFIANSENTASQIPGATVTTSKTDTLAVDLSQEVCGNNKTTNQNFVDLWEAQGYSCSAK